MKPAAAPHASTWGTYKRHLKRGERCEQCLEHVARKIAAYRARKAGRGTP